MIQRYIRQIAQELFQQFPVLTITGPRQSGKTVLVQEIFSDLSYVSLEDPDTRYFAQQDPRGFLNQISSGGIIDEIQHVPEIVSYIQTIVDEKRKNGLFVLTGSSQFELHNTVSQSLSGRTATLNLLPFTMDEAYARAVPPPEEVLYTGFYPRIFDQRSEPTYFLKAYVETYIQRDVRSLLEIRNLRNFERFLRLCAGRTGQILNLSSLGNDCGVTHKTASQWISVLEASFLIILLKPFHTNFNKRIIKSPKLYFLDVGLAAYLLGIESSDQLLTHPLRGALFETMVVAEFHKYRFNQGRPSNYYYFRDNAGNEVDLIFESGGKIYPMEIKSGATIHSDFFRGIRYMNRLAGQQTGKGALVHGGKGWQERSSALVAGYNNLYKLFKHLVN